jgi:micrococcal nuclease
MTRRRIPTLVAALLLLCSLFALSPATLAQESPGGVPVGAEPATVRSVVDGDTLRVTLADGTKTTVRLIGIDTPETKDPDEPVGCYGLEASARMEKLLKPGREVWLEKDVSETDRYERLLRYVWVEKNNGDVYLLNEVVVRDGYALAIRYEPDTARAERLEAAQRRAAERGAGLWSACPEAVLNLTPTPIPEPTAAPFVPTEAPANVASNCDPSYPTLCLQSYPDLDCGDIAARRFPVAPPDPHRFDGDGDGVGCESG